MTPTPTLTPAHTENLTLHLVVCYPDHEPRVSDPHYPLFDQARKRLKALGALKCWIGNADCQGNVELHHDRVEFSLANDVDVVKFDEAYGLHLADDEAFLAYVEGEGNLLPLCVMHHRSHLGIHSIPYPLWVIQRYLKNGLAAPARVASPAADPSPVQE